MQQQKNTFSEIESAVCGFFRLTPQELASPRRGNRYARPRFVAVYHARQRTSLSTTWLGDKLGRRDHTTIVSGIARAHELLESDSDFRQDVLAVAEILDHVARIRPAPDPSLFRLRWPLHPAHAFQSNAAALAATWV